MTSIKATRSPVLNPNIKALKGSPIREITRRLEQTGNDPEIISFGGGQPSFPPPKFVLDSAPDLLKELASHRYSSTSGIQKLRDAIANMMCREEDWTGLDKNDIIVTQSATNGIEAAVSTLAMEGDEALVVSPSYPGLLGVLQTHGIRTEFLETNVESEFRLDMKLLNEKIVKGRTRLLIVISPDNPTGRILSRAEVRAIGEIAEDSGTAILCDESYYRIIYNGDFIPFDGYLSNLVGVRSFSKTASATGWRIGYNYSNKQILEGMEKVNQFRVLCVTPFFQELVYKFVVERTKREEYLRGVLENYRARRDAMGESLKKWMPYSKFVTPQAGFYYFVKIPGVEDDATFSTRIFEKTKVAIVPGSAFGMDPREGYFRFTFVSEEPLKIEQGVQRIAKRIDEKGKENRIGAS